jgi:F-type H+-transporting ATPase subunit alpha
MAQIKADEITQLLREQIANYDSKVQVDEVGTITSLGDGIARLHGLDKVMAGELLSFPHNIAGLGPEPGRRFRGRGDAGRLHRAE